MALAAARWNNPDPSRTRLGNVCILLLLGALICMSVAASAQGPAERIYLIDNLDKFDGESRLYLVDLDETSHWANLTMAPNGVLPYDQCHLACSPDGAGCYMINRFDAGMFPDGGQLVHYDIATSAVTEVALLTDPDEPAPADPLTFRVPNVQQAGFDIAGTLYVGSSTTDKLYTVDLATGVASCVGRPIYESPSGTPTPLNLGGGDLAFTSDGRLFLWTNRRRQQATRGLYELFLPADPDCADDLAPAHRLRAEARALEDSDRFYGLAVRKAGLGDIVLASDWWQVGDPGPPCSEMHVHNRDGSENQQNHIFEDHYLGLPMSVGSGGDLSTGHMEDPGACPGRITEVIFEYTGEPCWSPNASNNDQEDYSCRKDLDGEEPVQISLRKKTDRFIVEPGTEDVQIGSWVSIASADSRRLFPNLIIEIRQGGVLLQLVRLHTSCSQPFVVGDQFGSLQLKQIITRRR